MMRAVQLGPEPSSSTPSANRRRAGTRSVWRRARAGVLAVLGALGALGCTERPHAASGPAPSPGASPVLAESGDLPAHVSADTLAAVRTWGRGRASDDARAVELAGAGGRAVTLPRVERGDPPEDGGALYVRLTRDRIAIATTDVGLVPHAWRELVRLGPDGLPPASAMRSVLVEPLRAAIDARWRAATELSTRAHVAARIWVAVVADADTAYRTLLALYATADAVGLVDLRFVVQTPSGLGTLRLRAALDVPELGTSRTARLLVGAHEVTVDPGVLLCSEGTRPCAKAALASWSAEDCTRGGLGPGPPRDFAFLAGEPATSVGEMLRALAMCRGVSGSALRGLPVKLSGDLGVASACVDGHITCGASGL